MQVASWLTTIPGASAKILEVVIPYSEKSTIDYLKQNISGGFSSDETAELMARRAYQRASALGPSGVELYGISATCALATNRPKEGDHRVIVGVSGGGSTILYKVRLQKGGRDRLEEDTIASRIVLGAVAEACLRDSSCMHEILDEFLIEGEKLEKECKQWGDPVDQLLAGEIECVEFCGKHVVVDAPRRYTVLLSGSFNPLHEGHKKMLVVAEKVLGQQGCFELSVSNPDKGCLSREEAMSRVEQFKSENLPVVLTNRSLFVQKTDLFEMCTFVVGYDTAIRLVNPKYYGSRENMMVEFSQVRKRGCSFCVAGRVEGNEFRGFEDITLPAGLEDLFSGLTESQFRKDISSTALRKAMGMQ